MSGADLGGESIVENHPTSTGGPLEHLAPRPVASRVDKWNKQY